MLAQSLENLAQGLDPHSAYSHKHLHSTFAKHQESCTTMILSSGETQNLLEAKDLSKTCMADDTDVAAVGMG